MRPQIGYYDGFIEEAAALLESLAMNHPFVDGNKRVAFAVTEVFLRMNGTSSTATTGKPTTTSWGCSIPTPSASPNSPTGSRIKCSRYNADGQHRNQYLGHLRQRRNGSLLGAYTLQGALLAVDPYNQQLIPVVGSLK